MINKNLKDTDFLYISSRIKSLENYNMNHDRYEKMIEAKSVEDAVTVLSECNYGESITADKYNNYEKLFESELKKCYNLIYELCPDKNIIRFFLYYYDCHNLKSIIKSEIADVDPDCLLKDIGEISIEKAKSAIRERNFSIYEYSMAEAAKEVIESFAKNKDPMFIDIIIDNGYYKDLEIFVKESKSKSKFLSELFKIRVDMTNILTTIRIIRMGCTKDLLKKALLSGGDFDEKFFLSAFDTFDTDEKESKFIHTLKFTKFSSLYDLTQSHNISMRGNISFAKIEKHLEEVYNNKIASAKFISYGSEVVISFLAAKEIEIKNVRIILNGKAAKLPNDVIREKLRFVYV